MILVFIWLFIEGCW